MRWNLKALGLACCLSLSLAPREATAQQKTEPRSITVTGEAEIRTTPDEVEISVSFETLAKSLAEAKSQHDGLIRRALEVARGAGVDPKDIKTSSLNMGPKYEEIKDKERLVGFEVSQSMDVRLRDLSKYEDLMTKLLGTGVNKVRGIEFRTSEAQRLRREAQVSAVHAAREKAEAVAKELGQQLGKPLNVQEVTESGWNAAQTANLYIPRKGLSSFEPTGGATVAPGELVVRAKFAVSFELN